MGLKAKEIFKSTLFKTILVFVVIFGLSFTYFKLTIFPTYIDGSSMYPTLSNGDYALSDKFYYKISGLKRFDIVTFSVSGDKDTLVKRIIAFGGEHLEYKDGILTIDGKVYDEYFLDEGAKLATTESAAGHGNIDMVIPEGRVFVMGDNRGGSMDSRSFGAIKESSIKSRGILLIGTCKDVENGRCVGRSLRWPKKVK